jgi:hypothetical protein
MKGHFGIVLPTKPYIKAYLKHTIGDCVIMSRGHNDISNKFYDLLQHRLNEDKMNFEANAYKSTVKLFVSYRVFKNRGCNLNETNVRAFNRYLELMIKGRFYFLMDTYCEIFPSFEANLPLVRKALGITEDDWPDDSMCKDYWRYRKENNLPLFYKKPFPKLSAQNKVFF